MDNACVNTTTCIFPKRSASGGAARIPNPIASEPQANKTPITWSDWLYWTRKNTFIKGMINPAPIEVRSIGRMSLVNFLGFFAAKEIGANTVFSACATRGILIRSSGTIPTANAIATTRSDPAYAWLLTASTSSLPATQVGR
jgi:hypothetical protein